MTAFSKPIRNDMNNHDGFIHIDQFIGENCKWINKEP